ncbi:MAG: undecaprenyl-diphosphate phosphatase [Victivallales bacterium]|nr:undecaprenyl-diphosphate phosphatase [Victivallales bacterium]
MFFKVVFLAIIQGITEFLPISSSGHLAIFQSFFGFKGETSLLLAVILHAGTLFAIIIYYFKSLLLLLKKENRRIILLLIAGSIPAGIFGILIKKAGLAEAVFSNLYTVGTGLLITGLLLYKGGKIREGNNEIKDLTCLQAFKIGVFQAFAVLPGISRSGSTIIGSISQKLKRNDAATFTFMLAIPAIAGAAFVEILSTILKNSSQIENTISIQILLIGFVISAVVGYYSLKLFLVTLKKEKLNIFSNYCFILGLTVIILQLLKF